MATQASPEPARRQHRARNSLASEHFLISWRGPLNDRSAVLHMAVSKKLLPRAVDRNRVRRLIREAVRLGSMQHASLMIRLTMRPRAFFDASRQRSNRLLRSELDRVLVSVRDRLS